LQERINLVRNVSYFFRNKALGGIRNKKQEQGTGTRNKEQVQEPGTRTRNQEQEQKPGTGTGKMDPGQQNGPERARIGSNRAK